MNSNDSPNQGDGSGQEEINRAQRAARERGTVDFAAYFRFLSELPDVDPDELRKRPLQRGEPFRL